MRVKVLPLLLVMLSGTSVLSARGPSPDGDARILTDVPFGLGQTTTPSTTVPA